MSEPVDVLVVKVAAPDHEENKWLAGPMAALDWPLAVELVDANDPAEVALIWERLDEVQPDNPSDHWVQRTRQPLGWVIDTSQSGPYGHTIAFVDSASHHRPSSPVWFRESPAECSL